MFETSRGNLRLFATPNFVNAQHLGANAAPLTAPLAAQLLASSSFSPAESTLDVRLFRARTSVERKLEK
jgi:hypothetical protein